MYVVPTFDNEAQNLSDTFQIVEESVHRFNKFMDHNSELI